MARMTQAKRGWGRLTSSVQGGDAPPAEERQEPAGHRAPARRLALVERSRGLVPGPRRGTCGL